MSTPELRHPERCPCGRPLHYVDPAHEAHVRLLVLHLGATISVTTPDGTWMVPRHYIALHGLSAADLPALAQRFKWVEL